MIKLKVKGRDNKFYDVLIDDDFKVSSKDKISKRITENLIEYTNLETTGAKGTLEHQFLNYLKRSKYNDVVKVVDFKSIYYPYDYEVNTEKYLKNIWLFKHNRL